MSKDTKKIEKAVASKVSEPEFYIYQLREHSREIFGVKPEVLDGALFNYKKVKITKAEARKLINSFLSKEVK
ncbi:hypothetical protein [Siminovitchia terrae]|uniref:hypothetical protein n=1 Tax=Siminovitchia terrae TaxID=1914933 RepID=UPI0035E3F8DE